MQFLVLSHRYDDRFTTDDFAAHLPAETRRVRELYARGVIQQIWQRADLAGAAFLVTARSLREARAAVDSLPLAQRRMSDFSIIPLRPYRGFGPDATPAAAGGAPA
jgi:hypothetical protein